MKRIIICLAAFMCCALPALAQEKYYGIKSGIIKMATDDGTNKIEQTIWFDDYGQKQTTIQTTSIEGFGTFKMYMLLIGDKSYTLSEDQKEVKETPRPIINFLNPAPEFKITELGKDKVLGRECTMYRHKQKQLIGSATITVWVWEGIVLKSVMKQGKREVVTEPVEFTPGAKIQPSVFDPKTYLKK